MGGVGGWTHAVTVWEGVEGVFAWDWATFWPELVSGLIAFALGVYFALRLVRHELNLTRRREFEQFQNMAGQVTDDFEEAKGALEGWSEQINSHGLIGPIDPAPLTWDIDEGMLRFIFAQYGVQRSTQLAVTWYRNAIDVARKWNQELRGGNLTRETQVKTAYDVPAAIEQLRAGIAMLNERARLREGQNSR